MLLSDDDCDAFVGAHASEDERAAYGLLRTGAQRADLFRLLFLKAIGGVYTLISTLSCARPSAASCPRRPRPWCATPGRGVGLGVG
jgi:mannosyltransferase OCH1-like enzyme